MGGMNINLTIIQGYNTWAADEKAALRTVTGDTVIACEQYGPFTVRKAAIRQMRGDSQALEEVGLASYAHVWNEVLDISEKAFSLMTDKEKFEDFKCHFASIPTEEW